MRTLRCVALLLAAVLLLGVARADMSDGVEELSGSTTLNASDIKLVLNPSKPKLTILGMSTTCPDGTSEGCKGEFLMTAVKDIYEVDASGAKVANRAAADVMDLAQGSWEVNATTDLSALMTPALTSVPAAAFSAPFKATIPACSPASTFPALAGNRTFIFQVLLFPADTNYTADPKLGAVEALKGNVKTSLTVGHWPFCSQDNKLVVELAWKSTKLGAADAPRPISVKSKEEVEADAERLADEVFDAVEAEPMETTNPATRRRLQAERGEGRGGAKVDGSEGNSTSSNRPKMSRFEAADKLPTRPGKDQPENIPLKAALRDKVAKQRPVAGLGRPSKDKRIFLSLPGAGAVDSKIDVPAVALIDDVVTNITVTAPTFSQGQGVQRVLLTFPASYKVEYDPTTAFATADTTIYQTLTDILNTPSDGAAPGSVGAAGMLALAFSAAAALLLM